MNEHEQVEHDKQELDELEDEIQTARQHLREQTHEGEHYLFEEPPSPEGAGSDTNAPG